MCMNVKCTNPYRVYRLHFNVEVQLLRCIATNAACNYAENKIPRTEVSFRVQHVAKKMYNNGA